MNLNTIENDFKRKVSEKVRLESEGLDRFRVFTPFLFEDGDHLSIILKKWNGGVCLSDEGHTFMHLTYDLDLRDLERGTRREIIETALATFNVKDHEGELISQIEDDAYGDALFSYVQALLRISDVTYLSRERIKSTFMQDFRAYLTERIPETRRTFDWSDSRIDTEAKYVVDCRVNGMAKPLFIFAIPNDDKCSLATITLLYYERAGIPFQNLSVFENQETIGRKVLARFTDVCDRQFSSLSANRDRIGAFIEQRLQETMQ